MTVDQVRRPTAAQRRKAVAEARARQVETARERERVILEDWLLGVPVAETAAKLGLKSPASVTRGRQRGIERRAAEEGPVVEDARARYLGQLEMLAAAWFPLALGRYKPDPDGDPLPPDARAAEVLLKILDRIAAGTAKGITPDPKGGDINIFLGSSEQRDTAIGTILQGLAGVADKMYDVEGELASANTTLDQLTGRAAIDDRPAPPPVRVPPREGDA